MDVSGGGVVFVEKGKEEERGRKKRCLLVTVRLDFFVQLRQTTLNHCMMTVLVRMFGVLVDQNRYYSLFQKMEPKLKSFN